jgi:hypothetical protein
VPGDIVQITPVNDSPAPFLSQYPASLAERTASQEHFRPDREWRVGLAWDDGFLHPDLSGLTWGILGARIVRYGVKIELRVLNHRVTLRLRLVTAG